jgi:outer membrane receptor protein involved in Fe transport
MGQAEKACHNSRARDWIVKKMSMTARLRSTVAPAIFGAALISMPAFAQDAPQTADTAADEGEAIIVTGSRIPQPNLTSTSPVTVLNNADIKAQGTTRVEDIINSLPQSFAGQTSALSNGASGIATVNLRGLGPERTLVLVNGRRLLPGDPTTPYADLNAVPSALVKRVDVLTGGASSVYGSDAVAGVVNFVMDTDFEGFRLDSQYSLYQHNNKIKKTGLQDAYDRRDFNYPIGSVTDGATIDVTATIGAGFDDGRGHVVAYAGYRKVNKVTQDRRDYSACTTQARSNAQLAANPSRIVDCGGSATSPNGTFFDWNSNTYQVGADRTFVPGSTAFNFAPTNYYQRPDERYSAGFFANYEINDSLKPYIEGMFMDDRTVAQIAASGNFGNTLSINCDNPLLSAQQLATVCNDDNYITQVLPTGFPLAQTGAPIDFVNTVPGAANPTYRRGFLQTLRRNVEGGPRQDDLQHTSYRLVGGLKGDLSPAFSYDAYYMFGRTNFAETYYNDFSISRLTKATDVVTNPATGLPACRSFVDGTDLNCVPYDIYALNNVDPAAVAYLATPGFQRGNTQERVLSGSVTGLLGEYGIKSPLANDGVAVNLGFEYRKESLELNTDTAFSTGDLAGQGASTPSVSGAFDVKELFGEVRVPLIQDGFVYDLSVEGAYRHSKYSVSGGSSFSTNTYKFGVDFAPIKDIRVRASYNRAVRAPNIQELFAPQRVALNGNADPCAGAEPDATLAQCLNTGITAAQYGNIAGNPAGQYNGFIGGQPDLSPETSTTKSIGLVLQPSFLPGFSATFDWFDIKVKDLIQGYGQDVILQQCATSGDPQFCSLVNRDPTGSLWRSPDGYVVDLPLNIGGLKTRGVDVNVGYGHDIGSLGSLNLTLVGTWLDKLVTDNGISTPYDCASFYGLTCGTPNPEWRHKVRLGYTSPVGIGVSVQWRYFSKVNIDRSSTNDTLAGSFVDYNFKIPAQSYFDLNLTAKLGDHYNFNLGVQNFFDKQPPLIGANGASAEINACASVYCNGNTYPGVYDALGRYIYAGITLDF